MPQPDPRAAQDAANLTRFLGRLWAAGMEAHSAFWDYAAAQLEIHRPPPRPGPFRLIPLRQDPSTMALVFTVQLPPDTDTDVVRRPLKVFVGGADTPAVSFDDYAGQELAFNEDEQVRLDLSFVDNGGRESLVRTMTATALDEIAPPQPGEFGMVAVRDDPNATPITNPTPEPPVEEPPAEEPPPA